MKRFSDLEEIEIETNRHQSPIQTSGFDDLINDNIEVIEGVESGENQKESEDS